MSGINEAFHMGGWGMYPTLFFGLLMIATALWYAVRPERRFTPLLVSCGLMTFVSGCLGFCTGVIRSLAAVGQVSAEMRYISLIGIAESLTNVVLAFVLIMLAMLAVSVGAWRLAHSLRERQELVAETS